MSTTVPDVRIQCCPHTAATRPAALPGAPSEATPAAPSDGYAGTVAKTPQAPAEEGFEAKYATRFGPSAPLATAFSLTPGAVTHVLYHANCPDGFGAAWAAWEKLGDNAKYIPVSYDQPPPELPKDAKVAIVDFSYPREQLLDLKSKVGDMVVLDHHESAMNHLQGLPFAYFDMKHSGARLSWDFFHAGEPVPDLVSYVEDRDIWRWDLPESREFSTGLASLPMDFRGWEAVAKDMEDVIKEGGTITRFKDLLIGKICKNARIEEIDGHKVPVVNGPYELASDVCDVLKKKYPEAPFVACYYEDQNRTRAYSVRTDGDFNVAELAEKFGGGGHKRAAAFRMPIPPTVLTPPEHPTPTH